mmetsp:Transcript_10477/g.29802  ORF Transcript_10477/g.29802 Transcript_10477/m.29802 type:complete len:183 (+) Transcript_10477:318-866(+)
MEIPAGAEGAEGASPAAGVGIEQGPSKPVATAIPDDDPLKGRWKEGTFGHPDRNIGGRDAPCDNCLRLVFLSLSIILLCLGTTAFALGLVSKEKCVEELRDCLNDCHNVLPDEECANSCSTQEQDDPNCADEAISMYNFRIWIGAIVSVLALTITIYFGCSYGLGLLSKRLRTADAGDPKNI